MYRMIDFIVGNIKNINSKTKSIENCFISSNVPAVKLMRTI